jgi:hypothetical protein
MSEFMVPLLVSLLVPCSGLALLLWLAHLEDTLDQAVQRRTEKVATGRAHTAQPAAPAPAPAPAPAGQRPAP